MSTLSLNAILLAALEDTKIAKDFELTKADITALKKKTGKIFIILDALSPAVEKKLNEVVKGKIEEVTKEYKSQIDALTEDAKNKSQEIERLRKPATAVIEQPLITEEIQTRLDDYAFLLPPEFLKPAMEAFDKSGEVKVKLHRTTNRANVIIEAGDMLVQATPEQLKAAATNPEGGAVQLILTEQQYARMQAGESMESVLRDNKAQAAEGEKAADFTPLKKPLAVGPEPDPVQPAPTVKFDASNHTKSPFAILCPTNREFNYAVVMSLLGNWKSSLPPELHPLLASFDIEPDTVPHRGRNLLATRFLDTGREWSLWFDSDIIAPNGNAGWFRKRAGFKYGEEFCKESALRSLTQHGRTIVSGVYIQRNSGGRVIAQPGLSPKGDRDEQITKAISEGPRKGLAQVDWVGFGCVAVHRQVFIDILEKVPGVKNPEAGKEHGFFTAFESGPTGEDVAFCKRAAEAGHPSFLDLSLHVGHIGRSCFLP